MQDEKDINGGEGTRSPKIIDEERKEEECGRRGQKRNVREKKSEEPRTLETDRERAQDKEG